VLSSSPKLTCARMLRSLLLHRRRHRHQCKSDAAARYTALGFSCFVILVLLIEALVRLYAWGIKSYFSGTHRTHRTHRTHCTRRTHRTHGTRALCEETNDEARWLATII
jgi:hypothetical protein